MPGISHLRLGALAGALVLMLLASPAALARQSPAPSPGSDWPLYGADLAGSRSNPGGPASGQVAGLHELWRFTASGSDFTGTPILAAGRVFAADNGGQAFALDAVSGRLLWKRTLGGPVNSSAGYDESSGRVYFAVARVGSPFLVALDATSGRMIWQRVLTNQASSDVYGSPTIFGGDVLIGTSGLFAETQTGGSSVRGSVLRLSGRSGAVVWQTFTVPPGETGAGVWSSAAVDPATDGVFVGSGNAYTAPAGPLTDSVIKLDFTSGAVLGHFQATPNDVWNTATAPTGPDYDFGGSPNLFKLADGTPVVGEGQKSGVYWLLRQDTLQPVWSTRVAPGSFLGGILGSTAVGGDHVFGPATLPGETWALSAENGAIAWAEPSPDLLKFGPVSYSNGVLYALSSLGFLQAWDAASGVPLGAFPIAGPALGGLAVAGGRLFVETGTQHGSSGSVEAFG